MKANVKPLCKLGRLLVGAERETPGVSGIFSITERREPSLNRSVSCARLIKATDGLEADLLPELLDVRLLPNGGQTLRIAGFERVDGAHYAQTWDIEVRPC